MSRGTAAMSDDAGSASVALVAVVACVAVLTAAGVSAAARLIDGHALAAAADASALVAADVASGRTPGVPCAAAERLASANGARVDICLIEGSVATVRVVRQAPLGELSATATAGPPGSVRVRSAGSSGAGP